MPFLYLKPCLWSSLLYARAFQCWHLLVGACPKCTLMSVKLADRQRLLSGSRPCRRSCMEFVFRIVRSALLTLFFFAGVSCDACLKGNFRGRRFKCLICYDYDLCASCYESGATTTRHTTEHPMQCILTRVDYGKDLSVSADRNLSIHTLIIPIMPRYDSTPAY